MTAPTEIVELDDLGFDAGAHVLIRQALHRCERGDAIAVRGTHRELVDHLTTWSRKEGHRVVAPSDDAMTNGIVGYVERGATAGARWTNAARAGEADADSTSNDLDRGVAARAEPDWGLAARGAAVEPGGPQPVFRLDTRDELWTNRAPSLYAQAVAAQWNPDVAIDWHQPVHNDPEIEAAVVQVMTFLIENEQAALVVPARFLGQVHPHFREIQQVLAVTVADEARHIEVFARRAALGGQPLALSTVGGRASLQTLIDEPDYATAMFLLSVMGEGTFVALLGFLALHAPDALTRRIAHLARNDEARHVAFAMSHLERHVQIDPTLRARLARAVDQRHRALQNTAGLNEEVFDSLVLLAAGAAQPAAVRTGWLAVQALQRDMGDARRARLAHLGFSSDEADTLSSLHTRNFM